MSTLDGREPVVPASGSEVGSAGTSIPEHGGERLLLLADFIDHLHYKRFDFRQYVTSYSESRKCGTVCCAIGWMPAIDPVWKWERDAFGCKVRPTCHGGFAFTAGLDYFDIEEPEYEHLFYPGDQRPDEYGGQFLEGNATPKQVAAHIREFVNRKWPELAGASAPSSEPATAEKKEGN